MEENFLKALNDAQRKAVEYNGGPALVIAGAGSGKTRVLTYKIAHLLQCGIPPYRILALTFTNKAAKEMKERIGQLIGAEKASQLWMGTFHSIFSRILRSNADRIGFRHDFTIYDSSDSKSLIKSIIKEKGLDDKLYKPQSVQSTISNAKNALITPSSYAQNREIMAADAQSKRPQLHEIYSAYARRCFIAGAMDFDDLLLYTNILFRDHPDVLANYQQHFAYILVDEYQDTNFAQHLIVSQLCKQHHQLCVVGDDAQSIYSFRGANIRNILNLQTEYPELRIFKLEQNYRSTQNIVDAANSLISKNKEQIRKHIFSEKKRGSLVNILSAYSDFEEGFLISNRIAEMHLSDHAPFNDFAILYRTNAQSRVLEEALRKRNIPYRIYGGLSFYQRKEIKDALAYFRLTINPNDEEALKRVINYPTRGIGDTTVQKVISAANEQNASLWQVVASPDEYGLNINNGTYNKLKGFADLINEFQSGAEQKPLPELAEWIIKRSGIFKEIHTDNTTENVSRQENIEELLNGIREFYALKEEEGSDAKSMTDFLAEISLATDQDNDTDEESDKVTMMTVHASKGLEFRHVFIVGVEDELFPSNMCHDSEEQIEEERRLLYVAITRAEETCTLSYASSRFRNGQQTASPPSRFLKDFDPQFVSYPDNYQTIRATREASPVTPWRQRSFFNERPAYPERNSSRKTYGIPDEEKEYTPFKAPANRKLTRLETPSAKTPQPAMPDKTAGSQSGVQIGSRICHSRFGNGEVLAIEGEGDNCKIKVRFEQVGEKQLLLKFAKFTII